MFKAIVNINFIVLSTQNNYNRTFNQKKHILFPYFDLYLIAALNPYSTYFASINESDFIWKFIKTEIDWFNGNNILYTSMKLVIGKEWQW